MPKICDLNDNLFNVPKRGDKSRTQMLIHLQEEFTDAIIEDINNIVSSGIDENNFISICTAIERHIQNIFCMEHIATQQTLLKYLRILAKTLYDELEYKKANFAHLNQLLQNLQAISARIGRVPMLNGQVNLPAGKFMPVQYYSKTQDKWAAELWLDPSGESVSFINATGGKAAARMYLLELEELIKKGGSTIDGYAICYAIADFEAVGNLRIDHLQPAHEILERQKELVLAMNLDPRFGQAVFSSNKNIGYIVRDFSGQYVGTKKFYMEYHNDVGNLWFISVYGDTVGTKLGQDAIVWLEKQQHFGEGFLTNQQVMPISCDCILYKTAAGLGLAEAARSWYHAANKQEICLQSRYKREVTLTMQSGFTQLRGSSGEPSEIKERDPGSQAKYNSNVLFGHSVIGVQKVAANAFSDRLIDDANDEFDLSPHSSDDDVRDQTIEMAVAEPVQNILQVAYQTAKEGVRKKRKLKKQKSVYK